MARVLGLLGGIGSGKSTVAAHLRRRGLVVLDADAEARAVIEDRAVRDALVARFGAGVLDGGGGIDRSLLAAAAFASPEATAALNALVHPEVRRRLDARRRTAGGRTLVLDVPLLLESPLADWVDTWIFVDASEEAREARSRSRGWAEGERDRRELLQADLAAKRARADYVLDNGGSIEDLERRIDALLKRLGVL